MFTTYKTQGNFLVLVSFIATAALVFFSIFTRLSDAYFKTQKNAEFVVQAKYAAEGILDLLPFQYNENNIFSVNTHSIQDTEAVCLNYHFDIFRTNIDQAVLEFGNHKCDSEQDEYNLGQVLKSASRMVDNEDFNLDQFETKEFRMTQAEFLEKDLENNLYKKPNFLEITWENKNTEDFANLEIIFVAQELTNTADENISQFKKLRDKIQIQRIQTNTKNSNCDETGFCKFTLYDVSQTQTNTYFDFTKYEYRVFMKSSRSPLDVKISGFTQILDKDKELIKLPSRFIYFSTTAILKNEQDPLKQFTHSVNAEKQVYTDFDSSFPYARFKIY